MNELQTDKELLKELCTEYDVSYEKVEKLLATIKEYQFKERRTGVYEALKEIIKSDLKKANHEI
ncbi:DNA modification system-associated small protein [Aliarcobacter butzleri]|uniref:DNA modification system-associated small protein n=1 Tax=Aliarcobacter butzleri TaxID=28197 RepID=UPI003AF6320B